MGKFIFESDYSVLIRDEIKDLISDNDYTSLQRAEQMAVAQIKQRIGKRYDMEAAMPLNDAVADPDTRDAFLVMIAIDLALYHLYTRIAPERIPQFRADRYQDAITWLRDVAKGEASADLPELTDEEGEALPGFRIKSKYTDEDNRW